MKLYFLDEVDLFQSAKLKFGLFFDQLIFELIELFLVESVQAVFDDFAVSKTKNNVPIQNTVEGTSKILIAIRMFCNKVIVWRSKFDWDES